MKRSAVPMGFGTCAAIALLALGSASPALGQGAEVEVFLAALPHVREGLPPGRVAVDPRPVCEARLIGWSCPAEVNEAAARLGVTLHGKEFTYVCLRGPSSCRLIGASSLVHFPTLEVRGSRATVVAETWRRTGNARAPIAHRRTRLLLERRGGSWRVTGEEELGGAPPEIGWAEAGAAAPLLRRPGEGSAGG